MIKKNLVNIRDYIKHLLWLFSGKPIPPTSIYKRQRIVKQANKFNCETFIEGGTFQGKTVLYVRNHFKKIYSGEIHEPLFLKASERTKNQKNIKLYFGKTEDMLLSIKNDVEGRCLFWLDAHYSGNGTGMSDTECPIINELNIIKSYKRNDHIILIDDAREFKGQNDYPAIYKVLEIIYTINPNYNIQISNDCIIITP